jgi:hypothetical protein
MAISSSSNAKAELSQSQKALLSWDNEGGAYPDEAQAETLVMTNAELVHLRMRVIALENLIIALLAEGSDRQLENAREMASYISPRAGFTQHPLTIKAANQMSDMVNRAEHFRAVQSA